MNELIPREALPPSLQEVADLIGEALTTQLVREFGGWRVYVPKNPTEECDLVRAVGMEAALKMATVWARDYLLVPACVDVFRERRDAELFQRYQAGEHAKRLARCYRLSLRHVYKILAQQRQVI